MSRTYRDENWEFWSLTHNGYSLKPNNFSQQRSTNYFPRDGWRNFLTVKIVRSNDWFQVAYWTTTQFLSNMWNGWQKSCKISLNGDEESDDDQFNLSRADLIFRESHDPFTCCFNSTRKQLYWAFMKSESSHVIWIWRYPWKKKLCKIKGFSVHFLNWWRDHQLSKNPKNFK